MTVSPKNTVQVSVIVCTYNRADLLKQALDSLMGQTLDKKMYEIIVIDNCPEDKKASLVVKSFKKEIKQPAIILVYEKREGLGYARNTGLRFAKGEYVAFLDDDAKAEKNWLALALDSFNEVKPSPFIIGGQIYPFYSTFKPSWFKDEYETSSWGEESRFLKRGESFSGPNMIFRKEVFDQYGLFAEDVGMKGDILSVGEETSLFERIWSIDGNEYMLYYNPKLIVYHLISEKKMNPFYHLKRSFVAGQAKYIRMKKFSSFWIKVFNFLKYLLFLIYTIIVALLQLVRFSSQQRWVVEAVSPIFYSLGYLSQTSGISIKIRR